MTKVYHNADNFKYTGGIWFVNSVKITYILFKTLNICGFSLIKCMLTVRNLGDREIHKTRENHCK